MRAIATGAAAVFLITALGAMRPGFFDTLDRRACDIVTAWVGPGHASGQVAIVDIDENTLARGGRWPWPRGVFGKFVRRILDAGAAVVVLDLMFPEEDRTQAGGAESDHAFAAALAGQPVVIGYTFTFDRGAQGSSPCRPQPLPLIVAGQDDGRKALFHATGAVCSVPSIERAAAGSGFLNAGPDGDGKLRRIPLVMEYGGDYYPGLALAARMLNRGAVPARLSTAAGGAVSLAWNQETVPLEGPGYLRMRFRGPRRSLPYISAAEFIGGGAGRADLRNKVVVLGASALGIQGTFSTPADPLFPASELQATAIDNLIERDFFRRPAAASFYEWVFAVAAGLASTVLLVKVRFLWATAGVGAMAAGSWFGSYLLLSRGGMLLSPFPATAALGGNYAVLTLLNYRAEKKRADQSSRRYRQLVENINDAIVVNDAQGRVVFGNSRFRHWFGRESGDGGIALEDYVAEEWLGVVREALGNCIGGHPPAGPLSFECRRPDGSRMWVEALISAVEGNGRIVGAQSALRDITARKQMEAQYLQAQKMEIVGRLAGGVAHDFNNLLQVINGYSSLILARLGERDDSLRGDVEEIRWAGLHAAELTQRMLVFSRKRISQPRPVELNPVIAETVKLLRRIVGEDIEVIQDLHPSRGRVVADATLIQQALMNLVVNARDSMPDGGKLVVGAYDVEVDAALAARHPGLGPGSYIMMRVSDTGSGMTEEVQRRIFEPFFTTKEAGKGTGLGLATVRMIVDEAGGAIAVSSALGEGSTFQVYFPRIPASEAPRDAGADSSANLRGAETVLVVEDDDAVRRFTGAALAGYGYRVLEASSAAQAVALVERSAQPIHLLVTDVVLRGMGGDELARTLRARFPQMPVLFLSGYAGDAVRGRLADDAAFLAKPFNPEALAARVRTTLDGGFSGRSRGATPGAP